MKRIVTRMQGYLSIGMLLVLLVGAFVVSADAAHAETTPLMVTLSDDPTNFGYCVVTPKFPSANASVSGSVIAEIFQIILQPIVDTLETSSDTLGDAVRDYATPLLGALMVLYVIIYGLMVTFEMIHVTWADAIMRLLKVGLIFVAVTSATFVSDTVRTFFAGGMNDLIEIFAGATGAGGSCFSTASSSTLVIKPEVLCSILEPLNMILSVNFLVYIFSGFLSGLQGIFVTLFIIAGLFIFLMSLLGVLMTYLKAVVLLFILLGLAPLFFVFLLFNVTKSLFDAWLGMILNFVLQPVLLFAFLGIFTSIMVASLDNILADRRACYATMYDLGFIDFKWWQFVPYRKCASFSDTNGKCPSEAWILDDDNPWGTDDEKVPNQPGRDRLENQDLDRFAPGFREIFIFIAVCLLCFRYSSYVEQIAHEITGGAGGNVGITSGASNVAAGFAAMGIIDPYISARTWISDKVMNRGGATTKRDAPGDGIDEMLGKEAKSDEYRTRVKGLMEDIGNLRSGATASPTADSDVMAKYRDIQATISDWKNHDPEAAKAHIRDNMDYYTSLDSRAGRSRMESYLKDLDN